ncbi:MAG TPA: HAD family hydrolase [Acidimicrobiales bacterium]|nr:HAD family hydrolase [Acidimicrobiales bacterium]
MIDSVIFDWGGTLSVYADVDMEDMWRLAARHLATQGAPDREDELCARLVAVEAEAWGRIAVDQHSFTLAWLLARASEAIGLDIAAAVIEEASQGHLDAWTPHIRHDPDARPLLRALKARGLRVGLLSNTHWPRHFHEHFLERDGLAEYLDVRLYTSELARSKPHPSVFHAAVDALGTHSSTAVFVGDRPYDDIHGAKSAGLKAVLRINSAMPSYQVVPDATIAHLSELLPLIDGWRAKTLR